MEPVFDSPHFKRITLTRSIWVKGKGLPKEGICLFTDGEEVTVYSNNGSEWYLMGYYKGRSFKVATMLASVVRG